MEKMHIAITLLYKTFILKINFADYDNSAVTL